MTVSSHADNAGKRAGDAVPGDAPDRAEIFWIAAISGNISSMVQPMP